MTGPVTGIVQRALLNLRRHWRSISLGGGRTAPRAVAPDLPDADREALAEQVKECLLGRGGEVSSRARAAAIGHAYLELNDRGRKRFLELLATEFGVDREALGTLVREIRANDGLEPDPDLEERLRVALTPRHLKLLTQFNSLPAGVKFLVDLRADLLRLAGDAPALRQLDRDLKRLLRSWFDIGFLDLTRITWDSPAALLERLIAYEAVHEIQSWEDLKNRLGPDRRCYAFFHPRMPDEPLVFVEVALVRRMSDSIQTLLDDATEHVDAARTTTAIFYSITNTQPGLRGVNLGTFLIKRVADSLRAELPDLTTFATLSPIPGFRKYLEARLREGVELTPAERRRLDAIRADAGGNPIRALLARPDWFRDRRVSRALKGPLMRLCAQYLIEERAGGRAPDRVANFHLSNGARVERINWLADVSERGLEESAGLMVNYGYDLGEIEANHEAYRTSGEVRASARVLALLEAPADAAR